MKTFNLTNYPLFYEGVWGPSYVTADKCLRQYGFESAIFVGECLWAMETEEFYIFDLLWRDL